MNMTYLLLGIIIIMVTVSGCIDIHSESAKNGSVKNGLIENRSVENDSLKESATVENVILEDFVVSNSRSILDHDDYIFMVMVLNSEITIDKDRTGLLYAIESDNNKDFRTFGKFLKDNGQKYIDEANNLKISPSMVPMFDKYIMSMATFVYIGKFVDFTNVRDMDDYNTRRLYNFMNIGVSNLNSVTTLTKKDYLNESNIKVIKMINVDKTIKTGNLVEE